MVAVFILYCDFGIVVEIWNRINSLAAWLRCIEGIRKGLMYTVVILHFAKVLVQPSDQLRYDVLVSRDLSRIPSYPLTPLERVYIPIHILSTYPILSWEHVQRTSQQLPFQIYNVTSQDSENGYCFLCLLWSSCWGRYSYWNSKSELLPILII